MNNPQVVIIGAGLDSRALRLEWPNNTTVFEVDFSRSFGMEKI